MNNERHPSVLATSACAYIRHKSGDMARSRLEYGYKHYVVRAYFTTSILTIIASEWPVDELRWTCPTRPGLISPKCQPGMMVLCTLSGSGRKLQITWSIDNRGLSILRFWRCVNDLKSQRLLCRVGLPPDTIGPVLEKTTERAIAYTRPPSNRGASYRISTADRHTDSGITNMSSGRLHNTVLAEIWRF